MGQSFGAHRLSPCTDFSRPQDKRTYWQSSNYQVLDGIMSSGSDNLVNNVSVEIEMQCNSNEIAYTKSEITFWWSQLYKYSFQCRTSSLWLTEHLVSRALACQTHLTDLLRSFFNGHLKICGFYSPNCCSLNELVSNKHPHEFKCLYIHFTTSIPI